jgi:16S rRNA C967 or C1407 C5-methylase (RsmB/RsmF family)
VKNFPFLKETRILVRIYLNNLFSDLYNLNCFFIELREYICVNGASIAPILALDLNPGVDLLDICAAPGTKSLMSLMTLSLGSITCNDLDFYRMRRVKKIFQEFTGNESPESANFTRCNAKDYHQDKKYHRVLADVPCSNDRISCNESDNSIFKTTRTKERLDLVNVQKAILKSSLQTMRPEEGSVTVYSTCTLSPVENDGVIYLKKKRSLMNKFLMNYYFIGCDARP